MDAFTSLVQRQRYEQIRIGDVLQRADVGRSTFYEHYRGKDDLLLQSLSDVLDVLAAAVDESSDEGCLRRVLEHFAERGDVARAFFTGASTAPVRSRVARELATRIERRLPPRIESSDARGGAAPAIGRALAEALLTFIGEWLRQPTRCSAGELAAAMRRGSVGFVEGVAGDGPGT